jgi:hypothetical protein
MKYTVVTTCNDSGLKQYGQRMIDTFEQHWPTDVELVVCAEQCQPIVSRPNTKIYDLLQLSTSLRAFVERHRDNPKAHGLSGPPEVFNPKKSFRWNAVRFSYKIYSIALVSNYISNGWLIWVDADTCTHSNIGLADLAKLCPESAMIGYLGRGEKYHSECGWVAYNLDHPATRNFIMDLKSMYDQDKIFDLPEWHDSYVWDTVRRRYHAQHQFYNLNNVLPKPGLAGHPFINSDLGQFMDHLKGNRKIQGRSHAHDLLTTRSEPYWRK